MLQGGQEVLAIPGFEGAQELNHMYKKRGVSCRGAGEVVVLTASLLGRAEFSLCVRARQFEDCFECFSGAAVPDCGENYGAGHASQLAKLVTKLPKVLPLPKLNFYP
jgi:hypothetical protein